MAYLGSMTCTSDTCDRLEIIECAECRGEGCVTHNPGWPDPQQEVDDPCGYCDGSGVAERIRHRYDTMIGSPNQLFDCPSCGGHAVLTDDFVEAAIA